MATEWKRFPAHPKPREADEHIRLRAISLGAGVQSTAMALMAAAGELTPMPDLAIFADTGWEPKRVYDHLAELEKKLPFPVHRVSAGNIRDDIMRQVGGDGVRTTGRAPCIPFFSVGHDGKAAPLTRQCTSHYKIKPILKKCREGLGLNPGQRSPRRPAVEMWIGISKDEAHRMKPAQQVWVKRRWPLIEKGMSRWDCLRWMEKHHHPRPGKSSCIGCPFHGDNEWREQRDQDPTAWADAVHVDAAIRDGIRRNAKGTLTGALYLHRSLKPLDQVDLSTPADRGQGDLFGNECEGLCSV